MRHWRGAIAALALVACAQSAHGPEAALTGASPTVEAQWRSIRVAVQPVSLSPDPALDRVGQLRFRGGLELDSDDPRFGGLSGLVVDGNGRLIAVSDQGDWFSAHLLLDADGALVGLADGRTALMRGADGQPLQGKQEADAEGLTRLPDGRFAVSFEQTHVVRVYDLDGKGPFGAAEATLAPGEADRLRDNDSLEALATIDDRLLVGAESAGDRAGPFWIMPLTGAPPPPAGRVQKTEGYGLVALDRLPDGDFLAMERFYAPVIGVRIVIRRVALDGLRATPARWEGPVVADFNPPVTLDNFEGLAVVPHDGGARIYIVADDNFSANQKTLLYAFDLE